MDGLPGPAGVHGLGAGGGIAVEKEKIDRLALEEAEREVRCLRWAIRRLTQQEPRPEREQPPAWAGQMLRRFERVE